MADNDNKMEKIVSLAKRRGFVFQGSDIYGGLAGTYDFGPLGVTLKNNIVREWWKTFVENREDMYGLDASILMNEKVWEASGHTGAGFADPIVEDMVTNDRYRADHLLKDRGIAAEGMSLADINKLIKEKGPKGVSSQTQGEQIRVTGKKRDDLQETMALLKSSDLEVPLQFENFRD